MEDWIRPATYATSASLGYVLFIIFVWMFYSNYFISSKNDKILYLFVFSYIVYVCISNTLLCSDNNESLNFLDDSDEFNKQLFIETTLYLNVFFSFICLCFLLCNTWDSIKDLSFNVVSFILVLLYSLTLVVSGLNITTLVDKK